MSYDKGTNKTPFCDLQAIKNTPKQHTTVLVILSIDMKSEFTTKYEFHNGILPDKLGFLLKLINVISLGAYYTFVDYMFISHCLCSGGKVIIQNMT